MFKKSADFSRETRTAMRDGNGSVQLEHIWKPGEDLGSPVRMYSRLILNPGCSIGWHVHQNEEEIFYILRGNALLNDNGSEVHAVPGDSIVTRSGEGHSVACEGSDTLEILAVIIRYQ